MSLIRSTTLALAVAGAAAFAFGAPALAVGPKKTHLLAMGACPEWKVIEGDPVATKNMKDSCQKDVDAIVAGLKSALNIDDENIMTRVDEEATAKGVRDAFIELDRRETKHDRVIVYMNFHGGNVDVHYNGYDIEDEVLAMYTDEEPASFIEATLKGDWMPMKAVRDLLNEIEAEEIVVIFEVCEVSSGLKNFRYNFARRQERDWKGREAIVFTSRGDQAATFNEDGTLALFTEIFSERLSNAESGNLRDHFEVAAVETTRSRRETCFKEENLDLFHNRFVYLAACTQHPSVYDPFGLMDDIHVGGHTVASRWHEVKDLKAPEQPATKDDDPFSWAKDILGQQGASTHATPQPMMMPAGPYSAY